MRLLVLAVSASAVALAGEKSVTRAEVPQAVLRAVEAKYPGAALTGFSREDQDGKTTWEVALTAGQRTLDLELDAAGAILETEETLAAADLPEAVKKAVAASRWAKAKVARVEKITRAGRPDAEWELQLDDAAGRHEAVFSATGRLLREAKSQD